MWARFDDRYSECPKLELAGPWCELLDMRGIIYCARNETDGLITLAALAKISGGIPSAKAKAQKLVEVGRWSLNPGGGFLIHDFLDYNPSHADLEDKRRAGKERAKRSRERNENGTRTFASRSGDPRGRAQVGKELEEQGEPPSENPVAQIRAIREGLA